MILKIPISYLQIDPKWKSIPYAVKGEVATIGSSGCGPTTCAMIVATLVDKAITPVEACAWALSNGFKAYHQGTYYAFIMQYLNKYKISAQLLTQSNIYHKPNDTAHKEALKAIEEGDWIICCMGKGHWTSSGHFILWYANDGVNALIRDPNSTKTTRTKAKISLLQNEVKYYWRVKVQKYLEDKEVVTERPIELFGKNVITDGILKDGRNYVSPRVFENIGLNVTNEGSKAIIAPSKVKVETFGTVSEIDGFRANGTNYVSLRELTDLLGITISWDNTKETVVIK